MIAGSVCVDETFRQVDERIECTWAMTDGDDVDAGTVIATVTGPLASVLTAERTALNFLGHLSGIATLTRRFVVAAGPDLRVWDTRKTTPGLRSLQKAAVRAGGGVNHRGNLSDWVMFKDNHLTVLGIEEAVRSAKAAWPGRTVHVEADSIDQLRDALEAGADAVLLDNMSPDDVRACVELATDFAASRACSGRCWRSPAGSPWRTSTRMPAPAPTWCPAARSRTRHPSSTSASTSTSSDRSADRRSGSSGSRRRLSSPRRHVSTIAGRTPP